MYLPYLSPTGSCREATTAGLSLLAPTVAFPCQRPRPSGILQRQGTTGGTHTYLPPRDNHAIQHQARKYRIKKKKTAEYLSTENDQTENLAFHYRSRFFFHLLRYPIAPIKRSKETPPPAGGQSLPYYWCTSVRARKLLSLYLRITTPRPPSPTDEKHPADSR